MGLLKISSRQVHWPTEEELAEVEDTFGSPKMSTADDFRQFIRDVESGKIKHFSWDMDISYDEFKKRVEEGYYDK